MPSLTARFLEPEALQEQLRADGDAALNGTTDTGTLNDDAARALTRVIGRSGEWGGTLDLENAEGWEARFLLIASLALGDDGLASQLLEGGWLDRRGVGARAFGSLPLRIVHRQVSRESLSSAREAVQLGWESELVNLIESASMRAARAAEEHVVVLREGVVTSGTPREVPTGISALLAKVRALEGTDLTLTVGLPATVHGPFGSRPLTDEALNVDEVNALLAPVVPPDSLDERGPVIHSVGSQSVGRFRVTLTTERGFRAATFRAMPRTTPTLDALPMSPLVQAPLLKLDRGLVLISGEPGSGRTTLMAALLQRFVQEGRHVASLEEPLGLPLAPGPGAARQFMLGVDGEADDFARAARLMPVDVVGFDLVDDGLALELALEASMDGRLALCVFRAPNVASAVHRAGVLDARFHRRRVSDGLSAVSFQRLVTIENRSVLELDFHLPTVALRRHVRAHETPAPPVCFESGD